MKITYSLYKGSSDSSLHASISEAGKGIVEYKGYKCYISFSVPNPQLPDLMELVYANNWPKILETVTSNRYSWFRSSNYSSLMHRERGFEEFLAFAKVYSENNESIITWHISAESLRISEEICLLEKRLSQLRSLLIRSHRDFDHSKNMKDALTEFFSTFEKEIEKKQRKADVYVKGAYERLSIEEDIAKDTKRLVKLREMV